MADEVAARADHSRFVQRIRRRYGNELGILDPGLPTRASIDALIDCGDVIQSPGNPFN